MKDYHDLLTIKAARHGIIQLNRPEKMNALSHNLRAELFDALKDFEMDPEVKVIIIRGSGRAFSAGYDLSDLEFGRRPGYLTPEWVPNVDRSTRGRAVATEPADGYWQIGSAPSR